MSSQQPAGLLIAAVIAVGVLHTLVPDHWVPITLLARQQGWSRWKTARAALGAGAGHTLSTLVIALAVWAAGAVFAARFGYLVSLVSSLALAGFGGWIAISSLREITHDRDHDHGHTHIGHAHEHRHVGGIEHRHWHEHHADDAHAEGEPVEHTHDHKTSGAMALMLILGSSPMVEGIPAFFAAAKYGWPLLTVMALCFSFATIATYVGLCVTSTWGLQRVNLGPLERYGEVLSGGFIALIGVVFLIWPVL